MSLLIVLVNYRTQSKTLQCLASLRDQIEGNDEIICVDNNSGHDEFETLMAGIIDLAACETFDNYTVDGCFFAGKAKFGKGRLILCRARRNLGFGCGCNLGVSLAARNDKLHVWFLNNDSFIARGAVAKLKELLNSFGDNAMFGTGVNNADSDAEGVMYGFRMDSWTGATRQLFKSVGDYQSWRLDHDEFVSGCSLVVDKNLFEQLGGFSAEYFLYYEEADLQARARLRGVLIGASTDVVTEHVRGASIGSSSNAADRSELSDLCGLRSRIIYGRRYHRRRIVLWYCAALAIILKRLIAGRWRVAASMVIVLVLGQKASLRYILRKHPRIGRSYSESI